MLLVEEHPFRATDLYSCFPGYSVVENLSAHVGDEGDLGREDTLDKEMATHSSILA